VPFGVQGRMIGDTSSRKKRGKKNGRGVWGKKKGTRFDLEKKGRALRSGFSTKGVSRKGGSTQNHTITPEVA